MATYISMLRGINVLGKKPIKMDALKEMYEKLLLEDVQTYIQSGNVLFNSTVKSTVKLEAMLVAQLEKTFGWEIPVLVLKVKTLEQIIQKNPFMMDKTKDQSFLHVTFLSGKIRDVDEKKIDAKKLDGEAFSVCESAIYLYCPQGYDNTKLHNNFLEKICRVKATTRNWRTVNTLLEMAKK